MATLVHTTLSADEWQLVLALRELPDSPVRRRLSALLQDLTHFIRDPRCQGMQADGAPCGTAQGACESCQEMLAVLEDLATRLPERV